MSEELDQDPSHMDVEQIDGLVAAAGADGAREILEAFWQSTTSLLSTLEKQIAEKAFDAAAATAHAVKGSAANVGAKRLAASAAGIETACKSGDHSTAGDAVPHAVRDFHAFKECFHAHLAES